MNKSILSILSTALLISGCGTVGQTNSSVDFLGVGSNSTMTSTLSSTGTSVLGTLMTTLLGNTTSQKSIVGTWTYSKPKIAFESENILAQLGSTVASSKLESTLDSQLKKIGFTSGKTSFTFKSDGTCTLVLGSKTLTGTYSYNTSTGVMTVQGALGVTSISPYVSVMGNEMYMLFEADKLLSVMGAVSNVAKTNTLSNLLGNYNGLKLGWTMTR